MIHEGVRLIAQSLGRPVVWRRVLYDYRIHLLHVTGGIVVLLVVAARYRGSPFRRR